MAERVRDRDSAIERAGSAHRSSELIALERAPIHPATRALPPLPGGVGGADRQSEGHCCGRSQRAETTQWNRPTGQPLLDVPHLPHHPDRLDPLLDRVASTSAPGLTSSHIPTTVNCNRAVCGSTGSLLLQSCIDPRGPWPFGQGPFPLCHRLFRGRIMRRGLEANTHRRYED